MNWFTGNEDIPWLSPGLCLFTLGGAVFGLLAGGSLVYEAMPAKEPRSCEIARELSDDYIYAQAEILDDVSARERAQGTPEWQEHDAAVMANLRELREISAPYREAFENCEAAR